MPRRSAIIVATLLGSAVLLRSGTAIAGSPLSNDASPLAVCEDTIRTAAIRLAVDAHRAISACLTRGIECLVNDPATKASCCERAAGRCESDLGKLDKERARFARFVSNRRCSVVSFENVLAEDGLGYERLRASCATLEPRAAADTLDGLAECIARLTVAATACSTGVGELPRGAEALTCTGLEDAFVAATGADLATCASAPGPTASAAATTPTASPLSTATPVVSPTPSRTGTVAAPSPTATALATGTPVSTVTATAQKTATAVPPTATATPTVTATMAGATATIHPTASPTVGATTAATPTSVATASANPTATVVATQTAVPTNTTTPTVTRTATPSATRTTTPTLTPTTTPTPGCGNGIKEAGEDCDDGNTSNCDACPSNCKNVTAPVQCASTTVRHAQTIHLALSNDAPEGTLLSAGLFCIEYPSGVVALPGTGTVTGRVSGVNALTSLNDFNNAVQLGMVATPGFTSVDPVISFDLCKGATAPPPANFTCVVKSASNQGDSIEPLSLVQCTPQ